MSRCLLTEEKIRVYCDEISLGNAMDLAAQSIGVAPRTVRGWLSRGKRWLESGKKPTGKIDKLCFKFADSFRKAESNLASRHIANITRKALSDKGPWQASAWLLERRWPEHFGNRLELRGSVKVIQICGLELTEDELKKFGDLIDPLMKILKDEIQDPEQLERISDRIKSTYQAG